MSFRGLFGGGGGGLFSTSGINPTGIIDGFGIQVKFVRGFLFLSLSFP